MTTRHLHLLRHAEAASPSARPLDHERPLTPRGRRVGAALADHLRSASVAPELVLSSSALRARETLDAIRPGLPADVEVAFDDGVYEAATSTLLARIQALPDDVRCVLVIGHNPAVGQLATSLAADGDTDGLERMTTGYPAGALASLTLEAAWWQLEPGAAALTGFVTPADLG